MNRPFGSHRWSVTLLAAALGLVLAACDPSPSHSPTVETVQNAKPTEAWFEEVSDAIGLRFRHRSGHQVRFLMPEINCGGIGLLDFDRDGWLDVFCVNGGHADPTVPNPPGHGLFRNLGNWRFEEVTARAGVGDNHGYGMGVACADYDGDGWTDLLVLNLRGDVLYRNRGDGTFEDVTAKAGVAGDEWSSSAAFFDYDQDRDLDLFVVNYIHWSVATEVECYSRGGVLDYCSPLSYRAPAMARLYRNRGDGTFEDMSRAVGLAAAFGNGLGIATADFDQDGWTDAFVANDATPNQLWMNRDRGARFVDEALSRGCALNSMGVPRAGMGTVAVDLLQKGSFDVFVTHLVGEGHGWFLNSNGVFADVILPKGPMSGSRAYTGFGIGFRDFDHDGEPDLFVANGRVRLGATDLDPKDPFAEPNSLLRGHGRGEFEEVLPPGGTQPPLMSTSRGAAFGDLDNDGAEDIVIANRDGPVHVLRNRVGARGNWIGFVVQSGPHLTAHNAVVQVEAQGRSWWRQVQPNEGYASSNDPRLVFGLGPATKVDHVMIRWPGGRWEGFGPFDGGRYHTLTEGTGQAVESGKGR
ncbi:MAG: CRTAC1 family protein [Verrucomicrobiales bacterium]|nr:CRTAC1 family protein [Verrucomicrobiales bacterium]